MLKIVYPTQQSKVPTSGEGKLTGLPIVKGEANNNETLLSDGKQENASDCKTDKAPSKAELHHPPSSTQEEMYNVQEGAIPASLKVLPNWVHWKLEQNDKGRATKVPYVAGSHQKAASDDPQTWRGFPSAVTSLNGDHGIGWVLPPTGEYLFIDLDHVRNPQGGEIQPWAVQIIEKVSSYTEISPSGRGLHILGRLQATVPAEGLHKGSIEFYTRGRYTTITGNRLCNTPSELAQVDVGWLYRLIQANIFDFPAKSKYSFLFNNVGEQWQAHYDSQSEADMALCGYLACKLDNVDDIDCAFRLSGLRRTS